MIILMGLAGSGKSTQGQFLADVTGGTWLSAGQVLRDAKDEQISAIQERGELVPDSYVIPVMERAIRAALLTRREVILDGYPRTVEQAKWVADNLADEILMVIYIDVPKTELIERMRLRGRADDQDLEAINERFRVVEQNIYTVTQILGEKGVETVTIDGLGSPEDVTQRLAQAVKTKLELNQLKREENA